MAFRVSSARLHGELKLTTFSLSCSGLVFDQAIYDTAQVIEVIYEISIRQLYSVRTVILKIAELNNICTTLDLPRLGIHDSAFMTRHL